MVEKGMGAEKASPRPALVPEMNQPRSSVAKTTAGELRPLTGMTSAQTSHRSDGVEGIAIRYCRERRAFPATNVRGKVEAAPALTPPSIEAMAIGTDTP
jgi:hypothetical protein